MYIWITAASLGDFHPSPIAFWLSVHLEESPQCALLVFPIETMKEASFVLYKNKDRYTYTTSSWSVFTGTLTFIPINISPHRAN